MFSVGHVLWFIAAPCLLALIGAPCVAAGRCVAGGDQESRVSNVQVPAACRGPSPCVRTRMVMGDAELIAASR